MCVDCYTFAPILKMIKKYYKHPDNLFLGAANTLYWPDFEEERLKGFRAYFQVPTSGAKSVARNTPARIVQQSQVATDINDIQIDNTQNKKILRSGQIFILRDGQFYNLLGNKITPKL
jgi:hypothetical protein